MYKVGKTGHDQQVGGLLAGQAEAFATVTF